MPRPLGRRKPKDREHEAKYPLRALAAAEQPTAVPVVLGINWYEAFDTPTRVGSSYYVGREERWGRIRGGHAICAKPPSLSDSIAWQLFYDQGQEGACVGFASSRCMTLLNRSRYYAPWLYREAQLIDDWSSTPPEEGTDVRSAMSILRTRGHRRVWGNRVYPEDPQAGIAAYRWAWTWDEVRQALGVPDRASSIPLLNSWGAAYPHIVRLPDEAGERLLNEEGEVAIPTDR